MLIAMAGLPGTGKSTLATRLAASLGGVVLSKDEVRAALFPLPVLDHSPAENDISMAAVFEAARYIRAAFPQHPVIIDGRTFLRSSQVRAFEALSRALDDEPHIIECICAEAIARQRLDKDLAAGQHSARNRTFDLYLAIQASAETIARPHLILDTGAWSLEACVEQSLAYLTKGG